MPTYVYRCLHCEERFEVQQPFSAGPVTECRVCGQGPVKKVFLPVGVTFKGSGFYKTDNRSSSGAKGDARPKAESAASGDGAKGSGAGGGGGSGGSADSPKAAATSGSSSAGSTSGGSGD